MPIPVPGYIQVFKMNIRAHFLIHVSQVLSGPGLTGSSLGIFSVSNVLVITVILFLSSMTTFNDGFDKNDYRLSILMMIFIL